MTMKEFRKDLEKRIKHYEEMLEICHYGVLSVAYEKVIDELKDIKKEIDT